MKWAFTSHQRTLLPKFLGFSLLKEVTFFFCMLDCKKRKSSSAKWRFDLRKGNSSCCKSWSSMPYPAFMVGLQYTIHQLLWTDYWLILLANKLINKVKLDYQVEILFSISVILFSQKAICSSSFYLLSDRFSRVRLSCIKRSSSRNLGSCAINFLLTGLERNFCVPN